MSNKRKSSPTPLLTHPSHMALARNESSQIACCLLHQKFGQIVHGDELELWALCSAINMFQMLLGLKTFTIDYCFWMVQFGKSVESYSHLLRILVTLQLMMLRGRLKWLNIIYSASPINSSVTNIHIRLNAFDFKNAHLGRKMYYFGHKFDLQR